MKLSAAELSCLVPDSLSLQSTGNGKLSGKKFVVKDLISVSGHVSSFGHPKWRETHNASKNTSPIISNLLDNGADLVGLAKLDQLAGSLVGNIGEGVAPLNPIYKNRFTGGSSSGSASAVAGDLVDFAIGTDTAGSVRVPAAACGLYGLRPTYGSITNDGVIPWSASFDVVGILSKDVGTIRDVYKILCKRIDEPTAITKLLLPIDCFKQISAEAAKVLLDNTKNLAKKYKLELQEINFAEFVSQETGDLFSRIAGRGNWQAHGEWIKENRRFLAADLQIRMEGAEKLAADPKDQVKADFQARESFSKFVSEQITSDSLLVMPVVYDLPPLRNATSAELAEYRKIAVRLNAVSGLSGLPELVIPASDKASGLTYGLGIIGSKEADISLLNLLAN